MPIVHLESFDHWIASASEEKYVVTAIDQVVLAAVAKKTGLQGLHFNEVAAGNGKFFSPINGNKVHNANQDSTSVGPTAGCGFWVKFAGGHTDDVTYPLFVMGWTQVTPTKKYFLRVTSGGGIELRRGIGNTNWSTAQLNDSSWLINTWEVDSEGTDLDILNTSGGPGGDGWHFIEFFGAQPENTFPTPSDIYELRVNNVLVAIDDTDLMNGIDSTTAIGLTFYRQEIDVYVDSLYSFTDTADGDDRFLGPVDIAVLLPDGTGSANEGWTPTNSPAYLEIDESGVTPNTPDDETTKITADGTEPHRHDWDVEDTNTNAVRWKALQVLANARVDSFTEARIKAFAIDDDGGGSTFPDEYFIQPQSGFSDDASHESALVDFNSFKYVRWIGRPGVLSSLVSRLDNMYFGLEKTGTGTDTLRVTQFVVEVAIPALPVARMTQQVIEYAVVNALPTPVPEVRMTQLAVEYAVRSPVAAPDSDLQSHRPLFVDCIAHSNGGTGFGGGGDFYRCVAEGNGDDGFYNPVNMVHCIAHGHTGEGVHIAHGQPASLMYVSCVGNGGYALNIPEVSASKVPFVYMVKFSDFGNALGRIGQSASPASRFFDIEPVTLAGDPYASGSTRDFSLNATYGDPIKNTTGYQFLSLPGTVSYHDYQAIQRQCPELSGDDLNEFTDTQTNRSIN